MKGDLMVGYYASWAMHREGDGKCKIKHIDPKIFTHLIYAFAGVGYDNKIKILNDNDERNYKRFTDLKKRNGDLKTLLSVGGKNNSGNFSKMAASPSARRTFVDSSIELLNKCGFDGLDIDWEFPAEEDRRNFVLLLEDLKQALLANGMMLSAAVSASKSIIDAAYDVDIMAEYLDLVNLMAYDLHGPWNNYTNQHSTGYGWPEDENKELNQEFVMEYWIEKGMPTKKMVLGVPLYGRTWTLRSGSSTGINAPASGPGAPGPYTKEPGFLGYNEICQKIADGWKIERHPVTKDPYAYRLGYDPIWCSYEDEHSVMQKVILATRLAGVMVWSIDTDDFRGKYGRKFNLIKTMRETPKLPKVSACSIL